MTLLVSLIVADWLYAGNPIPTAFFCVSDMVSIGMMQTVKQRGLSVTGDVSITGFDGLALGGFFAPLLTTVQSDLSGWPHRSFWPCASLRQRILSSV